MAATSTGRMRTLRHRSNRGRVLLARAVAGVATAVALVLLAGIALVLLKANPSNEIVGAVRDAAGWLAGPFDGMFEFDRRRTELAVNWGVAALVWYLLGRLLARVLAP